MTSASATDDLRILYVINSMEGGGAAAALPSVLSALQRQGASIRLLALTARNGLAIPASVQAGFNPVIRPGGERDHIAAARWLLRQARAFGATHIFTSLSRATLLGVVVAKWLKIPVVCWQHNAYLKSWNERLLRGIAGLPLIWVADSEEVAQLTRRRLRLDADRVVIWPIFAANPAAPVAQPWQDGQTLRIGSLGRLHSCKGYDLLITALGRLRQAGQLPPFPIQVELAGEGPLQATLEADAREQGLDGFRCTGFTNDPAAFLAGLHLYVQPSHREGFCIAAHEAMQAGLPTVVTATGEMPHSVTDGVNGHVIPAGDVAALTAVLGDLLAHPHDLAIMGARSRALILQRFCQERFDAVAGTIVDAMRAAPAAAQRGITG